MNPIYSLLEAPHRWLILASLAFGSAFVGAIFMLAYTWPHWLARVWFYLMLALTIIFLIQAFLEWRARVAADLDDTRTARRDAEDVFP